MEIILFLVFVLGIFGACILVGIIARSRGRSFFAWLFLSLIVSPILAGLTLLLIRQRTDVLDRRRMRRERLRHCPSCAELVRQDATVCRFCKTALA